MADKMLRAAVLGKWMVIMWGKSHLCVQQALFYRRICSITYHVWNAKNLLFEFIVGHTL